MSTSFTDGFSSFFSSYGILIVLMIAMFAVMIIPQRRRDKKVKDMLGNLKAGDRVRTISGIYGTIGTIQSLGEEADTNLWRVTLDADLFDKR